MFGDCKDCAKINLAIKEWIAKQGHDKCWYYPEIFKQIAEILDIPISLSLYNMPTKEDFELGCERFRKEIYPHHDR